jgi:hypothetical protein
MVVKIESAGSFKYVDRTRDVLGRGRGHVRRKTCSEALLSLAELQGVVATGK